MIGGDPFLGGFDGERDEFVFGAVWGNDAIGDFEGGIDKSLGLFPAADITASGFLF